MIKAVIFDADGVLINGVEFSVFLNRDYGISTDKTLPFFNGIFKDCLLGKADLKIVIEPYLKEWGWNKSVDEFLEYWFKSEHNIDEKLVEYIQNLRKKGIKCYLATNQEKYRVQYMLNKMGFAQCFDRVYASCQIGYKKPSMEFYSKVIEDLGMIDKQSILFWDDTKAHVDSAKDFGINGEIYSGFKDYKRRMKFYLD